MDNLLIKGDPVPFIVTNEDADNPVLLTCEHSGGALPQKLSGLGLSEEQFQELMEIAPQGDNYAGDIARELANKIGASLIESTFHRIIVDVNRGRSERFWLDSAEGISIPVNVNITSEEIEQRTQEIWDPFDNKIKDMLHKVLINHKNPFVLSIHTYHKTLKRDHESFFDRPWQIGVLWDEPNIENGVTQMNRQLGEFFAQYFECKKCIVGRNQPYDLRGPNASTNKPWQTVIHRHLSPLRIPSVLLEIRNDQVITPVSRSSWAKDLNDAIPQALEIVAQFK